MRLDKYLSCQNYGTRSQLKKDIKNGLVSVNGVIIRQSEYQIDENNDKVQYGNRPCVYEEYVYYMLNKPAGVVSATKDEKDKTVLSLLTGTGRDDLFPVGRLDKDTEGLLLMTNDGALAHKLLAPGKHVEKIYECTLVEPLTDAQKVMLEEGVDIGEKKFTLPAKVTMTEPTQITLTITEGKFHQVKRMLSAVGNQVLFLKRICMGNLYLDSDLKPGEYRKLTREEINLLRELPNTAAKNTARQNTAIKCSSDANILSLDDFDAVIFDLDGSLVDSMWLWHAIDIEYLAKFGIEAPDDLQSRIGGRSFSETAVFFKEHFNIPDGLDQIKADWNRMAWDKYTHEVPLKDGVAEFISCCMQRRMKLGIATSNSRELVENVLSVHELNVHFDCIMTGCDVEKGKPAPDIYLAVSKELGILPKRCLVFEDIIHGIMAGHAAGMKVCAVYDDASAAQDAEKRKLADYYIHDFRELVQNAENRNAEKGA